MSDGTARDLTGESDCPAVTCRILPTYSSVEAQMVSWPQGLVTWGGDGKHLIAYPVRAGQLVQGGEQDVLNDTLTLTSTARVVVAPAFAA